MSQEIQHPTTNDVVHPEVVESTPKQIDQAAVAVLLNPDIITEKDAEQSFQVALEEQRALDLPE